MAPPLPSGGMNSPLSPLAELPPRARPAPLAPHAVASLPRIVIVGGGAGGLELATQLGDTAGRRREAEIILVDQAGSHVWKPLLHEVAAGSPELDLHELDYLAQAHRHHFSFHLGRMCGLDRQHQALQLAPLHDEEGGLIAPARTIRYDVLVIAVGSLVHDFGTPGVREHALPLDSAAQARRFHQRLLSACAQADLQDRRDVDIVIVGGGATGVELAAELRHAAGQLALYRFSDTPRTVRITLLEAAPRLLSALPEDMAQTVRTDLEEAGVSVRTDAAVAEVRADAVVLKNGERLPSTLTVWAAGVRAPSFLAATGLPTNRLGQLVVDATLRCPADRRVFAFGDCAAAPDGEDGSERPVPPLAQAAHQEAVHLARNLPRLLAGRAPRPFRYQHRGTLISLGRYGAVGTLVGRLTRHRFRVEGWFARWAYRMLYRRHLAALYGLPRTVLLTLGEWLSRPAQPPVKLH